MSSIALSSAIRSISLRREQDQLEQHAAGGKYVVGYALVVNDGGRTEQFVDWRVTFVPQFSYVGIALSHNISETVRYASTDIAHSFQTSHFIPDCGFTSE